jgi:hypothetical protein
MEYQDMKNIFQNSMLIAYGQCANFDHTKYVHYPIFLQLPFKYTYNKANSQKLIHHVH